MNKKRVAILTSHLIPYQTSLFKELAQNSGIEPMIYFCWDFSAGKESFDPEFGKKIKWDVPMLDGYKYKFLKNFSLNPSSNFGGQINFGIIKEIINGKFDAILIFGWNSFTNWLVFLTAFLIKIPVLLKGENPLNQELLKQRWKIKIKKIILGILFKFISGFLYIGEENKKFYQYYGVPEKKLFFVPYAVDNERYLKASSELKDKKYELRRELGIKKNDVVILFVGKLIEKKRPMDLLKAFSILKTFNVHLLYVGDGILRQELEKYAKEYNLKNVYFVGFKNQTELPLYYTMADIFVLPSGAGETWGLVVNEAMCFELPFIVSYIVGCGADLAKSGENGFIFPVGDVNKLVEYLTDIIKSFEKRKEFSKKSFEIIKEYSYENDIRGILKALKLI